MYENFGSFSEILVGRTASQTEFGPTLEAKFGHYFQEVYLVNRRKIRLLGVRKLRSTLTRTRKSEIIKG